MADLLLSSLDLVTVRFAVSRAVEIAMSVRVLQHDPTGLHRAWVRAAHDKLQRTPSVDLDLLLALVPRSGFLADVLTPTPARAACSLQEELDAIAALDPALLHRDIAGLREVESHRGAQVRRTLDLLERDPGALRRVADTMGAYWELVLAEHWPAIRRLLDADVRQRSGVLTAHGLQALLHDLSPRVELLGDRLRIEAYCHTGEALDGGRGLVLTPSVFCQPRGLVAIEQPFVPAILYHALGAGNLWQVQECAADHALDDVLGRTRAQLLRAVGIPSTTTELAGQLNLAAATVNTHLTIPKRAGLTDSARDGRAVLYRRTPLGNALLSGAGPGTAR